MNIQYYFRHMSSSEALKYAFESKVGPAMESLIQVSSPIRVTLSVENDLRKVHVSMHARNHSLIEAEEVSEDMLKSIDLLMDTLHRRLTEEKDRQVNHKSRLDPFHQVVTSSATESDLDDEFEIDSLQA